MKRDMAAEEFDRLSNEAKKKYVVSLLIKDVGAKPVVLSNPPIAIVMAGIPGAGKTEYLDSLAEEGQVSNVTNPFVRIDLDQVVTIYPGYTPKTYAKFRSQGNTLVARCIDVLRKGRYNMMIDGTFSGKSGSSLRNVKKLLDDGYVVSIIYMYDLAQTAWEYTRLREIETDRGIDKDGFLESCENVSVNLREAAKRYRANKNFSLLVVKQKVLRDKNYEFISNNEAIDKIINQGYNIDRLKEIL